MSFDCPCGKVYKFSSGLYRHRKTCLVYSKTEGAVTECNDSLLKRIVKLEELVAKLMKIDTDHEPTVINPILPINESDKEINEKIDDKVKKMKDTKYLKKVLKMDKDQQIDLFHSSKRTSILYKNSSLCPCAYHNNK